jgi:arginase
MIKLVSLPYDSGRKNQRMGRGPTHLLEQGILQPRIAQERDVEVIEVSLDEEFYFEASALVELQRRAVPLLQDALLKEQRVLLLSGNCGVAALSGVAALGARRTGVIWFDAHADFNTPETSPSGFLDGMALAILTGHCWPLLAARFDHFEPLREQNVILIGARHIDPAEGEALNSSGITQIAASHLDMLGPAIQKLAKNVDRLYVHLDVDVLDEAEGRVNSYACPGGLSAESLYSALQLVRRSAPRIGVAAITSYDPACDDGGRIRAIIEKAAAILAG